MKPIFVSCLETSNSGEVMRAPARIEDHLTTEEMSEWLHDAPDEASYKRRMAVWLTHTKRLHARKVAETLGVSVQAVWLWIGQYNARGPAGLQRKGRGGRRWCYLTVRQEAEVLESFMGQVRAGEQPRAAMLKLLIEKKAGRRVSMQYIYRLLARHNWAGEIAQSHPVVEKPEAADDFRRYSRPWLRNS